MNYYIFHQIKNLSNDSIPFLHSDISRFFFYFLNSQVEERPILDKQIDETDELVLEDELQRARLHFTETDTDLKVDQFVTGIVCGILGCMNKNESSDGGGKFRVKKVFMPDHPIQRPAQKLTSEPQIAFISG